MAEALADWKVVMLAQRLDIRNIVLESDSLEIVQML